ncbi:Alpha/Beta hydrolase protein [Kockovaella imperatae]|uniref:triacylglycerol lipase n=1 Tax=Kockovaella imperatae TaxID=4999 RepID=A0A1Y1U6P6_9TREE|nr:Alpha/Beta hydrolase protein [Kockovaella imperatae]ORX33672.1 Alpha/Beta hydrolase protein [Kockovaella imperatae]
MYLWPITKLAGHILPILSTQSQNALTFEPIHAFGHTSPSLYRPRILIQNASSTVSFLSTPALGELSTAQVDEYLLDNPAPHLMLEPLTIRTRPMTIRRPRIKPPSILSWAYSARRGNRPPGTEILPYGRGTRPRRMSPEEINSTWIAPDYSDLDGDWEDVEVEGPDVSDRQTLITLAKMMSNAYVLPDGGEWWPLGKQWNATIPFGWEPDADGLRGHIFADPTNSTVIVSIKGTSAGVLGVGGPTAKNDKYNDNLMFSCCCARVDFSWYPVCDCWAGGYKCEQTCLEDALVAESVYATVGTDLYNNVTYMYPHANIWLVGHSLGGSVSAMIGLSFGAPAVTIEAPGDRLPASRLHLPLPPGMPAEKTGITHVYHTADPIPMGACTGAYSGCYAAGFAMESSCHTGQTILYDTVTVKGWAVDIRTHRIGEIINKVLADPWPTEGEPDKVAKWRWWAPWRTASSERKYWAPERSPPTFMREQELSSLRWGWGRKGPKKGQDGDPDSGDDDDDWNKHGGVPKPEAESNCTDCYRWEFGDDWGKK